MTNSQSTKTRKRPDVTLLQEDSRFKLVQELDFGEIIPFVLRNIKKQSTIKFFYLAINGAALFFLILYAFWGIAKGSFNTGGALLQILAGILAGSILVIPPHELLHGLAYRLLGSRSIRFGADFSQFIFYVTADQFPISRRELTFLALTPFVLINLAGILLAIFLPESRILLWVSLLFCHNIMCIGDFAMVNYAFSKKGKLYTFDDIMKKKSYFFELIPEADSPSP